MEHEPEAEGGPEAFSERAARSFLERDRSALEIAHHRARADSLQEQIAQLKVQADALARRFKQLYAESQQAYNEGGGAEAKLLAELGHAAQQECQRLNERVASLIAEAAQHHAALRRLDAERVRLHRAGVAYARRADEIRKNTRYPQRFGYGRDAPSITGFRRMGIEDGQVARFLRQSIPAEHLAHVRAIEYSGDNRGNVGAELLEDDTIRVYGRVRHALQEASVVVLGMALVHEIGEAVFRRLLSDQDRLMFSAIPEPFPTEIAEKGPARDVFSETYRLYIQDPELLRRKNPERYEFLRTRLFKGLR